MQKALARLAHAGLIPREHGRGTFVSGHKVAPADVRHLRFLDEQGHPHPMCTHLVKRLKRKGPWSDFLGGEAFVRMDRTINVGGQFDLSSEFWLREEDFENLGAWSARSWKPICANSSAAPGPAYLARGPMDPLWQTAAGCGSI